MLYLCSIFCIWLQNNWFCNCNYKYFVPTPFCRSVHFAELLRTDLILWGACQIFLCSIQFMNIIYKGSCYENWCESCGAWVIGRLFVVCPGNYICFPVNNYIGVVNRLLLWHRVILYFDWIQCNSHCYKVSYIVRGFFIL